MPQFTIETTFHLPVFRHSTYLAETPDVACRFAIEDTDCSGQREDCESSGEAHVTGIWEGAGAAYRGQAIPVHAHFGEAVQRKAAQFELMLACSRSLSAMLRPADRRRRGGSARPNGRSRAAKRSSRAARDPVEPGDAKDLP
ncbi:hypothetical protein NLY43_02910 [Mesorhizobium sp. C416B]|uniref:hypothetical protein n=1 Tax=Mesorhizobium sp. C416B TaxID=2956834 RepID=UPI001FDA2B24|nr:MULTISPECIES: hypothetical protein [unclassified Mesorhizobium]WJI63748.1 hypothetical protein NLY43_02910 [Mesorhizobium sp. C416B]